MCCGLDGFTRLAFELYSSNALLYGRTLVKKILEQLQELTKEEQENLLDILNRTSLSNIVKTIKEIDHRLDVLETLKVVIAKEILEIEAPELNTKPSGKVDLFLTTAEIYTRRNSKRRIKFFKFVI